MAEFTGDTRERLVAAGWSPERNVDTREFESALSSAGFPVPAAVRKFLQRFGGLAIEQRALRNSKLRARFIEVDPRIALKNVYAERISEDYAARVGAVLCPVGMAANQHLVLIMTAAGDIYCGVDEVLSFVGADPDEAIDALCQGKKLDRVR